MLLRKYSRKWASEVRLLTDPKRKNKEQIAVPIRGILFDVIGTTIIERDRETITRCFEKAFLDHGLKVDAALVQGNRGRNKQEMIERIVLEQRFPNDLTGKIYQSFLFRIEDNLDQFSPADGADELFRHLRKQPIKIGLGTGLSRDLLQKIMSHVGWRLNDFDYVGIPEGNIRSRPHPDMIHEMLKNLSLIPSELVKIGDTIVDIQEGKNAGVRTVAILSGTQPEELLRSENPDFLIRNLQDVIELLRLG